MPTLEISKQTEEMLEAMADKYGLSPSDLINLSVEMTDKVIKDKDYDLTSVQTLLALQVSFLGCANSMMKSSNAAKMVFESHPISVTIQDMERKDYKYEKKLVDSENEQVA